MTTLALKVDVDDSALGRLKTSVSELSRSIKTMGAEVGASGSDAAQKSMAAVDAAMKKVRSSTQELTRGAKQSGDAYAAAFNQVVPTLEKVSSSLDRIASAMERSTRRVGTSMKAQKQATAEAVVETQRLTAAENSLAAAQERGAAATARKKASQSISAVDSATGYRYTVSSRLESDAAMQLINGFREQAQLQALGRQQTAAIQEDESRTRKQGLLYVRAAQEDESRTRKAGLLQVAARLEDENRTRKAGLLQVAARLEDENRTRKLGLLQTRAQQEDESRTRKQALLYVRATQEDETRTRKQGLLYVRARQEDESRTRKQGLLQVAAQIEDENRTRKLGLLQAKAQDEDENRTRRSGVLYVRAHQEDERRTRRQGLWQIAAMMEDETRTRKLGLLQIKAQQEEEKRAQAALEQRHRTLVLNDRYADMSEKGQLRTQRQVLRGLEAGKTQEQLTASYGEAAVLAAVAASSHELGTRLDALNKTKVKAIDGTKKFTEAQHAAHSALRGFGGGLDHLWLTYGKYAAVMAATYGATQTVRQTISKGMEFEYQTDFTSAISNEGYSREGATRLREGLYSASDMDGVYSSALELSRGLRVMQQAGLDASVALDSIGVAAKVALIGETDLKTASEDLIGVLEVFGLQSKNPLEMAANFTRASDVMAYVSTETKANLHDVAESFKNVIGAASAFNVSLETTAALTEVFGKAGVVGPKAGTYTRNFYEDALGIGSKTAQRVRDVLGLQQYDQTKDDPIKYIDTLVERLRKLDATTQNFAVEKMFDERGRRLIRELVADFETLDEKVARIKQNSVGMTDNITKSLGENTKLMFQEAGSDLENALTRAYEGAAPALQKLAISLSQLFESAEFRQGLSTVIVGMADFTEWVVKTDGSLVALGAALLTAKSALSGGWVARAGIDALDLAKGALSGATNTSKLTKALEAAGPASGVFSSMDSGAARAAGSVGLLSGRVSSLGANLLTVAGTIAKHPALQALLIAGGTWYTAEESKAATLDNQGADARDRLAARIGLPTAPEARAALQGPELLKALKQLDQEESLVNRGSGYSRPLFMQPVNDLRSEIEAVMRGRADPFGAMGDAGLVLEARPGSTTGSENIPVTEFDPKSGGAADRLMRRQLDTAKTSAETLFAQLTETYDFSAELLKNAQARGDITSAELSEANEALERLKIDAATRKFEQTIGALDTAAAQTSDESSLEYLQADRLKLVNEFESFKRQAAFDTIKRADELQTQTSRASKEAAESVLELKTSIEQATEARRRQFEIGRVLDPIEAAGLSAQAELLDQIKQKREELERMRREAPTLGAQEMIGGSVAELDNLTPSLLAAADAQTRFEEGFARSPMAGFESVLRGLRDQTTNLSAVVEQGLGGSLDTAANAFVNLATTGKISIRGMVADMLVHLAKLAANQAFASLMNLALNAAFSAGGSWYANTFQTSSIGPAQGSLLGPGVQASGAVVTPVMHTGGVAGVQAAQYRLTDVSVFNHAPRYHTGTLAAGEVPAILKRGEGVFTKEQMRNLAPASGGGSVTVQQSFTVNVQGGQGQDSKAQGEAISRELRQQMKAAVMEVLVDQKRPGGVLA